MIECLSGLLTFIRECVFCRSALEQPPLTSSAARPRCAAFGILIGLFKRNDPLTADLFGCPASDPFFWGGGSTPADKMASRFLPFSRTPVP